MKKLLGLIVAGMVLASSTTAMADGPSLFGQKVYFTQDTPAPKGEAPKAMPDPVSTATAITLFHCVKYKDLDEMAPCAETKIIKVLDPCPRPKCCDPCNCCPQPPRCVYIKICVPKSCCCSCGPRVKCNKSGTRVTYDYGKYEVDIRVKKGYIEVDYQD